MKLVRRVGQKLSMLFVVTLMVLGVAAPANAYDPNADLNTQLQQLTQETIQQAEQRSQQNNNVDQNVQNDQVKSADTTQANSADTEQQKLNDWMRANASYDYVFTDYDVDIQIDQYNKYRITERMKVHFNQTDKHGIYRTIPYKVTLKRTDGSTTNLRARISDVVSNNDVPLSTSAEGGSLQVKLGDPDSYITSADQEYSISYTYDYGKDKLSGADEVYHNVIGTDMAEPIYRVNFRIKMPKEFTVSADNPAFSVGKYGTAGMDSGVLERKVSQNIISGHTLQSLKEYEGVSIRLTLPDGYFRYQGSIMDYALYLPLILAPLAVLVVYLIWRRHGRDDLVTKVVQYEPPRGLNSLDAALAYGGSVNSNDVVSLLIVLANRGYITIGTEDENWGSYTITKVKDYDGSDDNERRFMQGMFALGSGNIVTKDQLENKFYSVINDIVLNENNSKKSKAWIAKNGKYVAMAMGIEAALLLLSLICFSIDARALSEGLMMAIFFVLFPVIFGLAFSGLSKNRPYLPAAIVTAGMMVFLALFIYMIGLESGGYSSDVLFAISYFVVTVAVSAIAALSMLMSRWTAEGNCVHGEILGYKDFIETVDKARIEAMVNDNPKFYYDVLPYAYVLGVTKVWTEKFEGLTLQPPEWYHSSTVPFSYGMMSSFATTGMSSMSSSMSSSPSSSSSSSGGGGFSGGGGGGGGSGSW